MLFYRRKIYCMEHVMQIVRETKKIREVLCPSCEKIFMQECFSMCTDCARSIVEKEQKEFQHVIAKRKI